MICRTCGQDKVAGDFTWKTNGKIAHGQKCKACFQELNNTPEFKERQRSNHLMRLYGISSEDYDTLLREQGGVCAICHQESDTDGKNARLHVDHDHVTGKVRSLLCYRCNVAMGFLSENKDRIYQILDYLNVHSMMEK
jgi:hypothetical protein